MGIDGRKVLLTQCDTNLLYGEVLRLYPDLSQHFFDGSELGHAL